MWMNAPTHDAMRARSTIADVESARGRARWTENRYKSGLLPADRRALLRARDCSQGGRAVIHSSGRHSSLTQRCTLTDQRSIHAPLLPTLVDALNAREWTYTVNEELSLLTFGVGGEHSAYNCALFADDETRLVTMIAQSPMRVPHEERLSACELLMRANHGLMFGGFDLDFNDGEVRFKVAVDVEGGTLGVEAVHSMITVALDMYELWYPPLMKVVYGGISPEDAVAEVNAELAGDEEGDGEDSGFDADDDEDASDEDES